MFRLTSVAANLAWFVGGVLLINGAIFALGLPGGTGRSGGPPGWLVGAVWVALFTAFGLAHWMLRGEGPQFAHARFEVEAFAILCAIYPAYTLGLGSLRIGLAGNIVTALAAGVIIVRLWPVSTGAALLVLPVVPWLAFASYTIIRALAR